MLVRLAQWVVVTIIGDAQIEALVPVWVERPFGDGCRLCLLAIDGGYRERIGESCDMTVSLMARPTISDR